MTYSPLARPHLTQPLFSLPTSPPPLSPRIFADSTSSRLFFSYLIPQILPFPPSDDRTRKSDDQLATSSRIPLSSCHSLCPILSLFVLCFFVQKRYQSISNSVYITSSSSYLFSAFVFPAAFCVFCFPELPLPSQSSSAVRTLRLSPSLYLPSLSLFLSFSMLSLSRFSPPRPCGSVLVHTQPSPYTSPRNRTLHHYSRLGSFTLS
ncbi:hypothetical protein BZA70DRAFT_99922 [Myxozyma melibiosi]|uniref:Transmembrane protein n=1 Tax=Myxozyma melibiosi TaxID=54550 RepID=A0ABR1EYE7_9ASCO